MRSSVRVTGCKPPRASPRPGRVTSSASSARRASSAALRNRFATLVERGLDGALGDVDRSTGSFLLLGRQLAQALQEFGNLAALAEKTGFDLFQRVRVGNGSESRLGFANDLIEIVHGLRTNKTTDKQKRRLAPPFSSRA